MNQKSLKPLPSVLGAVTYKGKPSSVYATLALNTAVVFHGAFLQPNEER
jgi:hypothetical protein